MFAEPPRKLLVSIVLYESDRDQLATTLASLEVAVGVACERGLIGGCTLLVVDHSPQALAAEVLAGWRRQYVLLNPLDYAWNPANPGFGAGHNGSFARAVDGHAFFLVANPDLDFYPDSIASALAFLEQQPEVGLLGPALAAADGSLAPACFRYPDLLTLASRLLGGPLARQRSWQYQCRDWNADQVFRNPPVLSGCCMLFRSHAFAALKGFDPGYFLYFEDFDISWRAGRQGLSCYCPSMRVRHHGGATARKNHRHRYLFIRSALRFFRSHGWKLA